MEKLSVVPLGISNSPNFSGFVVMRVVPLAGGCLRRLSFRVCTTYSSFAVSSYSMVSLYPSTSSTSLNILGNKKEYLNHAIIQHVDGNYCTRSEARSQTEASCITYKLIEKLSIVLPTLGSLGVSCTIVKYDNPFSDLDNIMI